MVSRRGVREAELLLPLTAGLLSVAVHSAVPVGWALLLDLLVLLALGAVLPGHPWRTGAVAAIPAIVAALVRAAGDSMGTFAVLLIASPVFLALTVLVVKGGALLVAPPPEPRTAGRRWRPFETQAARGRFLVIVAVVLVVGVSWSRNLGAGEADRAAGRRVEEIRGALQGQTVESLRQASLRQSLTGDGAGVPGGPYRSWRPGPDRFTATAEVRRLAQYRCIHVEVDTAGAITTNIVEERCD